MIALSDLQIASLLEEIAASMHAGVPMIDTMQRLQDRRLGAVAAAAREISERLDRGVSLADAVSAVLPSNSPGVAAALRVSDRNSDPELIVCLARLLTRRSNLHRDRRFGWFHPTALLIFGLMIGVFVMAQVILSSRTVTVWPANVVAVAEWSRAYGELVILIVLAAAFILWIAIARRGKFPLCTRRELFCRSLADQIRHGVPEADAIRVASQISGEPIAGLEIAQASDGNDPESGSTVGLDLKNPSIARIFAPADVDPSTTSHERDEAAVLIARLDFLANFYREKGRRRDVVWSRLAPRTAAVLIGCSLIFIYSWWVIAPVYREMGTW